MRQLDPANTFTATIWVGLKEGYDGVVHTPEDAKRYLQARCDFCGLCVSVTETTFIYTNGTEPGLSVGLINYPRFPVKSTADLEKTALEIAEQLMIVLGQLRVTIVLSDRTITIESDRVAKAA